MRRALALFLVSALCAAPCFSEPIITSQSSRFVFENEAGEIVGLQSETYLAGSVGSRSTIMRYRVDGLGAVDYKQKRNLVSDQNIYVTEHGASRSHQLYNAPAGWLDEAAFSPLLMEPKASKQYMLVFGAWQSQPVQSRVVTVPARTDRQPENGKLFYRLIYDGDLLTSARRLDYAPDGHLRSASIPMLGYEITVRLMDEKDQRNLADGGNELPFEHWKLPYRMNKASLNKHMRYRFALPFDALLMPIPTMAGQRAVLKDGEWQLDICTDCADGSQDAAALYSDAENLARWRQPNAWLNSNYKPISKLGKRVAAKDWSDSKKMVYLAELTRKRINAINYKGYLSARDVWKRRSGDCTEDALLLASLARASDISARVVHGLVFSRGRYFNTSYSYLPHSWVVAYVDGKWRPFDTEPGFDASHIGLTISDGEPDARFASGHMSGLLEWKSVAGVKQAD